MYSRVLVGNVTDCELVQKNLNALCMRRREGKSGQSNCLKVQVEPHDASMAFPFDCCRQPLTEASMVVLLWDEQTLNILQ